MKNGDTVYLTVGGVDYQATILNYGEKNSTIRIEDGSDYVMDFPTERLRNGR